MTFTVAITVWKREHLLAHAIHSVMRQSFKDWEIRVYSDGSSRLARDTVDALSPQIPISYQAVRRRRRCWGNHLRRLALEQARGTHVCFLGHDCVLYEGYLAAHAANVGDDPCALSVVPVDYWREIRPDGVQPANPDLMRLSDGEIDLLCIAYPRALSLEVDCFCPDMWRRRCADFLSFDRLRQRVPPVFVPSPTMAAHF